MGHLLSQIGVTKQKENQFLQKKIETVEDLLNFFPRKYYDFRVPTKLQDLKENTYVVVHGRVIDVMTGTPNAVEISDADGYHMKIFFFGQSWLVDSIQKNTLMYFGGKIGISGWGVYSMTNPIYVSKYPGGILPVYSKIQGMSDQYLKGKIKEAISFLRATASFDQKEQDARKLGLMEKASAYEQIHRPKDRDSFKKARMRIDFERIYDFYKELHQSVQFSDSIQTVSVKKTDHLESFVKTLPFALTHGQAAAVEMIKQDALAGKRLNAIVSGDVGCGKTLVAIAASVLMWENNLQTVVMAPTLVLAKQHFEEFSNRLSSFGIHVALLTSDQKKKERTEILKKVASGDIEVLIGTHAVLSPELKFRHLGLTVIDEEHKFGVRQKETIMEFDKLGAHHLSMTATPIPRSYAMSVYGDMVKILTIPDKPAGRKETITKHVSCLETALDVIYDEIQKGHQAYLVTPFIEESDNDQFKDIASVATMSIEARKYYSSRAPGVRIACISGDMKQSDILEIVDDFAKGKYDLLISTTIVEVGVNIPNATVIAIMNADRFGLAALHQLRGRVGRNGEQGICLLVSDMDTPRLDTLCTYSSGFDIAEQDLKLRGPGELTGEKQSGDDSQVVIETILRRPKMAAAVRKMIEEEF